MARFRTAAALACIGAAAPAHADETKTTVFAPTNDAFAAAIKALGATPETLLADKATLTSILRYHVVATDVKACNGIIHVIDAVLVPPAKPMMPATGVDSGDLTPET